MVPPPCSQSMYVGTHQMHGSLRRVSCCVKDCKSGGPARFMRSGGLCSFEAATWSTTFLCLCLCLCESPAQCPTSPQLKHLFLAFHVLELVQKLLTAEDLSVQVDMGFVLHEAAICFSGSHHASFLILMTCFLSAGSARVHFQMTHSRRGAACKTGPDGPSTRDPRSSCVVRPSVHTCPSRKVLGLSLSLVWLLVRSASFS